jgi:hypothetical protein
VEGGGEHLQQLLAAVRPAIIAEMNTMLKALCLVLVISDNA